MKFLAEILFQKIQLLMTSLTGYHPLKNSGVFKDRTLQGVDYRQLYGNQQAVNADAIVNPNLQQCDFPSKCLAGVGVAFYLMLFAC